MSEPQLRCLLCDLILADENARDYPTETCKQCGRKVLAGQTQDQPAGGLQPLNPPAPEPKPIDLDLELLPEAAVVPPPPAAATAPAPPPPPPPSPLEDDIPTAAVLGKARRVTDDVPTVPTVQPRRPTGPSFPASDLPTAARRAPGPTFPATDPPKPTGKTIPPFVPPRKTTLPDPSRSPSVTPRPQVLKAFGILGCMTLMAIVAITVIIACIVIGLKKAAKVQAAPSTPPAVAARVG